MANPDIDTPRLRSQLKGYTSIVAGHVAAVQGVAYLELARPQRHNSFHEELWSEFPKALQELDVHPDTRVIVISGQGRNFCAGIDVGYLRRNFAAVGSVSGCTSPAAADGGDANAISGASCPGAQRAAMRRSILALQDAYSEIERCRSPVLAAVHGRCIGGGVDLITACDLRICSEDATFCVKEVDLAITADLGTLQRLHHIVGHGVAMELALTARNLAATEAQRIGLVSAVIPAAHSSSSSSRSAVVAGALRLAASIASKPTLAVQGTKRVLLYARDQPRVSDGLDYVATWNSAQLVSSDLVRFLGGGGSGRMGSGGVGVQATANSGLLSREQEGSLRSRL